ncbi:hypothetical protein [Mycetocola reblochoni]|uniref:hypothetical protein n=1 Tax=Mycetocola reblochoni TaxID=331618 RepID=UPI00117C3B01|nr:hypothetical protein [Mycetocola reblochoni]
MTDPDLDKLAEEIARHKLIHVSVSRDACYCRCGEKYPRNGEEHLRWFDMHLARAVFAWMQRDVLKARLDAQAPDEDQRKSLDRVIGAVVSNSMNHPVPHVVLGRDVSGLRMKLTDAVLAWLQGNGWAAPDEGEWEYTDSEKHPGPNHLTAFSASLEALSARQARRTRLGHEPLTIWRRRRAGAWEPVVPPS